MKGRSRRFIFGVGAVFIAIMGWLTGYIISNKPYSPPTEQAKTELQTVEQDLTQYIAEKLKQEKHGSSLQKIVLMPAVQESNDSLRIPYTLTFDDMVEGESTTSLVQATAYLKRAQDAWRVTKVQTEHESVTYNTAALITKEK